MNDIDIAYLNIDESRMLGLSENSAAYLLTQYFYSGDTIFMYTRSIKRPDRFQISIELERKLSKKGGNQYVKRQRQQRM